MPVKLRGLTLPANSLGHGSSFHVADPDDGPRRVTVSYQQPGSTALYGNDTQAADLGYYREQIRVVMQRWEPSPAEPAAH